MRLGTIGGMINYPMVLLVLASACIATLTWPSCKSSQISWNHYFILKYFESSQKEKEKIGDYNYEIISRKNNFNLLNELL